MARPAINLINAQARFAAAEADDARKKILGKGHGLPISATYGTFDKFVQSVLSTGHIGSLGQAFLRHGYALIKL